MGGRLALGAQCQRRRSYPRARRHAKPKPSPQSRRRTAAPQGLSWFGKATHVLDLAFNTAVPILKPILQASFVVHKPLQSGPISERARDNLAVVVPRSVFKPRYHSLPPAPVRLGIGMPEMALPAPLLQQPALYFGTIPAQPNPVFTLETPFVEYRSPVWTPTDEFTATLNLILAFFSILLLIPTSVFLSSANKGKRAGAGRVFNTALSELLPFEPLVISLLSPTDILIPLDTNDTPQDGDRTTRRATRSAASSSSSSSSKGNTNHPQSNKSGNGNQHGSNGAGSGSGGSGRDDRDGKGNRRKKGPTTKNEKPKKKSKKSRKGKERATEDSEDEVEPENGSTTTTVPTTTMWALRSRPISRLASTGSLSSLSSLADSIFPGDDGPSGSGNSTDPTSAFNEVTSSGNESLGTADSENEAFVDQSLRVEIAANEPEANNAPAPHPPPAQHIKQEFHPGDPEDPDDPDGHMPGVFGDIPLADLPSASPVTLRMVLNLVWRLSLAYALFGVYVGALKLTKYWSIRLLDFARQSIHDYARSQARRGSMKSALSNGHNTLSPSRRSPWYYKAILGLVAASTVLPQSPMGGFLNPSVPPPTSSLVARPACTGSVWRPPPTKTWVLGNYVEADYVVAASHHRSTVRFSILSPYQSSIHHNNHPIALADVLGRTLVALLPIAGHLLQLLQGLATAFALALLAVVALACVKQVCRFIHAFVHSHFYAPLDVDELSSITEEVLPLHVETNPDRDHETVEQICTRLGIDDAFCYLPAGVEEATGPTTVYSADDELVSASDSDVSKLSLSPSRGGVMDALKADVDVELAALAETSSPSVLTRPTKALLERHIKPLPKRATIPLPFSLAVDPNVAPEGSSAAPPAPSSGKAVNVPLAAHHHLARKTRRVAQRSPLAAIFQPMVHPRMKLPAWHPASAPPQRLLGRKENMLHRSQDDSDIPGSDDVPNDGQLSLSERYVASQFLPANTRIFQGGIAGRARSLDEYHTTQLGELRGAIYGSFAKLKLAYQKKIALCDDSSEGLDLFCQHRLWFSDTLEILRRLYDWKFALILSEQMEEQHRFEYGELLTQANLAASGMADSASEDIANRLRAASMRLMAKREFRSSLFNRANPPPPINHHDVEPNSPFPTPPI